MQSLHGLEAVSWECDPSQGLLCWAAPPRATALCRVSASDLPTLLGLDPASLPRGALLPPSWCSDASVCCWSQSLRTNSRTLHLGLGGPPATPLVPCPGAPETRAAPVPLARCGLPFKRPQRGFSKEEHEPWRRPPGLGAASFLPDCAGGQLPEGVSPGTGRCGAQSALGLILILLWGLGARYSPKFMSQPQPGLLHLLVKLHFDSGLDRGRQRPRTFLRLPSTAREVGRGSHRGGQVSPAWVRPQRPPITLSPCTWGRTCHARLGACKGPGMRS